MELEPLTRLPSTYRLLAVEPDRFTGNHAKNSVLGTHLRGILKSMTVSTLKQHTSGRRYASLKSGR